MEKMFRIFYFRKDIVTKEIIKNCRCDIYIIDFHKASFAKHIRSKSHLENIKKNAMITLEWLFHEIFDYKPEINSNPKPLREIASDNI